MYGLILVIQVYGVCTILIKVELLIKESGYDPDSIISRIGHSDLA